MENKAKDNSHKNKSLDMRLDESQKIMTKFPEKICAYIERSATCKSIEEIDKHKFLIPRALTVAEFIYIIRKRLHVAPEKGLFFFVNNYIISGNMSINEINNKYKSPDGFLYITYSAENCYGTGV